MSKIILILTFFSFLQLSNAQMHYSKAKVFLNGHYIEQIAKLGIDIDHGIHAKQKFLINDFTADEIKQIENAGFEVEILIDDVVTYYRDQKAKRNLAAAARNANCTSSTINYESPSNYAFGSMGGFQTYSEMLASLENMATLYPDIITVKKPVENIQTENGNSIYWIKVSDNPNMDEDEDEILYTALHHAREPASLSQMIYFLWYLLENYKNDEEIKFIIDNTEMYFMPCINPDGYLYNEQIEPEGGGLWRKNRSIEDGRIRGVDLNRNYGFEWGFDNTGSSPNPGSDTYRGQSAFSEPETQAVKIFCEAHDFKIALNYHSYGDLLIHPWGFVDGPTEVDSIFKAMGNVMTEENDYFVGTGIETVGYTVNGDSDDWMYGEATTKNQIFSLTPEIGPNNFGFWPAKSEIEDINKSSLRQNINAARLLLTYIQVSSKDVNNLISNRSGTLSLDIENVGLKKKEVTISVETKDASQLTNSSPIEVIALANLENKIFEFDYVLSETVNIGDTIEFLANIDYGTFVESFSFQKIYFEDALSIIFSESGDDLNIWDGDQWGLSTNEKISAPSSITDSPNGPYARNENKTITLNQEIDLTGKEKAYLNFWAKWELEKSFDYVQIRIATEGGEFLPLCGLHTNLGSIFQDENQPLYDGTNDWVEEYIDISEFADQKVKFQFVLISDQFEHQDGFYFDDFKVLAVDKNTTSNSDLKLPENYFNIFPNPAQDNIQISFLENNNASPNEISISNAFGQIVYRSMETRAKADIDLNNWISGIYFVRI